MQKLYHSAFDPFSRKIRAYLDEVGLKYELIDIDPKQISDDFLRINPAGETPVLRLHNDTLTLCGHDVICETIEDMMHVETLLGARENFHIRSEVRRLVRWFDIHFYNEVTLNLFMEKVIKPHSTNTTPNTRAIQAGYINLRRHCSYIEWLLSRHNWLGCDQFSLADISAAAQISLIDYTGDIDWSKYKTLKNWYMLVKSRPSFQPFWSEIVSSRAASDCYSQLDF